MSDEFLAAHPGRRAAERSGRVKLAIAFPAAVLAATVVACGGGSDSSGDSLGAAAGASAETGDPPAVDPGDFADADADDVEVIRGWTDALREWNVDEAASFFALPSVAENGAILIQISTEEDARVFNSSLPCGAYLIGASSVGVFTTAQFSLTEREGAGGVVCGAQEGATADAAFVVQDGKIAEWRRVGNDGQPPSNGSTV